MSRRQGHRPRLGVVSTLTDINLASRAVVSNRPDKRCRGRPTGSNKHLWFSWAGQLSAVASLAAILDFALLIA